VRAKTRSAHTSQVLSISFYPKREPLFSLYHNILKIDIVVIDPSLTRQRDYAYFTWPATYRM